MPCTAHAGLDASLCIAVVFSSFRTCCFVSLEPDAYSALRKKTQKTKWKDKGGEGKEEQGRKADDVRHFHENI